MKKILPALVFLVIGLAMFGCKPEFKYPAPGFKYDTVVIQGHHFKAVNIGKQSWLAEDYYVFGAEPYLMFSSNLLRDQIGTLGAWRIPTISDYNKLTQNVSGKVDSNGNNYADGADDLQRLILGNHELESNNALHFGGELKGYCVPRYWNIEDRGAYGYYLTKETLNMPNGQISVYKLGFDFAGITKLANDEYLPLMANVRLVRDNE